MTFASTEMLLRPWPMRWKKCGVFLMAVCEEYQKSDNCKREAEYAITLNRTVIPLMVQKDFKPSSWLGLIQGSQMYYDLTETNVGERQKCFVDLIEEIKTKMGEAQQKAGQTSSGQTGEGKSVQGKTGVDTKVDTFQKGKRHRSSHYKVTDTGACQWYERRCYKAVEWEGKDCSCPSYKGWIETILR
ncbi:uncharacterized protein [Littorina saxatilis]|uniref:uncharacterized protein n=1 Tax=Littorina saxatilis TaxID=31220 RepID=UPI0038B678E4